MRLDWRAVALGVAAVAVAVVLGALAGAVAGVVAALAGLVPAVLWQVASGRKPKRGRRPTCTKYRAFARS